MGKCVNAPPVLHVQSAQKGGVTPPSLAQIAGRRETSRTGSLRDLRNKGRIFSRPTICAISWLDFLYWDVELEP